jgi:hypothetical protein
MPTAAIYLYDELELIHASPRWLIHDRSPCGIQKQRRETPRAIVTDRAAIFTAAYTETWCALMGIVTMKTTAHRSARVNGLVEVTIQQLEAAI